MGGMPNDSRICKIQICRGGRGSEQMSDSVGGSLRFPCIFMCFLHSSAARQNRTAVRGNQVYSSLTSTSHKRLLLNG